MRRLQRLILLPANAIERVAVYLALRRNELDKTLVQRPHRARWLFARSLAVFLAVLAGWAVYVWSSGDQPLPHVLLGVVLGGYLGTTALGTLSRPMAYRSGWLDGRATMVAALSEAQRRGLSPDDWLRGQWEADAAVLGISPALPTPPEEEDL